MSTTQNPSSNLADYFQQEEPRLGNQFTEDSGLLSYLQRVLPASTLAQVEADLTRFGQRVAPGGDILVHGRQSEHNPPRLINYNAFGRYDINFFLFFRFFWYKLQASSYLWLLYYSRIDKIEVADGWNRLQDISAEEVRSKSKIFELSRPLSCLIHICVNFSGSYCYGLWKTLPGVQARFRQMSPLNFSRLTTVLLW